MTLRTLLVTLLVAGGTASSVANPELTSSKEKSASPAAVDHSALSGAGPVVVATEVLESWRFLYRFVTEVEFVLCLEGRKDDDKVYVESFRFARMEAANSSSVRYQPCTGSKYIGTAHNHPPVGTSKSLCYQSLPDRRSFEADQKAVIDIVLCGEDQFYWAARGGEGQQFGTATAALSRE